MGGRKLMSLRKLIVIVGIILSVAAGHGQVRCPIYSRSGDLATHFVISIGTVTMPVGAFLLIRKDGQIAAIRLTSIDPAATQYLGKSTYESFFQPDRSGLLSARNVDHRTGEVDIRPTKGVHAVYLHTGGNRDAHVGKWTFRFVFPSLMVMSDASFWSGFGDHGYEFAPTSACTLSEIDAADKQLRWFRWDRSTQIILPLSDLPK